MSEESEPAGGGGLASAGDGGPGSAAGRAPGWREVLLVAVLVVGIVLGLAVLTSALPTSLQDVVFRTPLAIVVLVVGTVGLLAWLARRRPEA